MRREWTGWTAALLVLAACGGEDGSGGVDGGRPDASRDAAGERTPDGAPQDGSADDGGVWRPPEPPWPRTLPDASQLGPVPEGYQRLRAIIHLHSPISHDACDGEGWRDGGVDETCLGHLREGLCAARVDVAMLTDHAPHLNELSFERAFLVQDGDEVVYDEARRQVGAWWACPSDHRVLVTVGSENALMPVALHGHPRTGDGAPDDLESLYDGDDAVSVARFREAGGFVLVNHTEQRPLEWLRAGDFDGVEIYNLHANVDPRIETGGGVPSGVLPWLLRFRTVGARLTPDLAFLVFVAPNEFALDRWDALLAEGRRPLGTAGTDAHENALPWPLADGERGDSYRRMIRWFSNMLLVDAARFDEAPVVAVREALRARRLLVAFEAVGSPVGLGFEARTPSGDVVPVGGEAPVGSTLRLGRPELPPGHPAEPAPSVRLALLRVEAGGATEVAANDGEEDLTFVVTAPGVYRGVVTIEPNHAWPYVPELPASMHRPVPWVYTNPIFVPAP